MPASLCRGTAAGLLLLAAGVAGAHPQQPDSALIDAVFAAWDRDDSPGCALGVIRDGRLAVQRGYGMATLDHGIRNGADVVYYVGSVSKQFTAAAIALLADDGRISLDDDVRRYIPELPDYGRPLTIRYLVHHTSGLRDIYTLMSLAGIRMEDVMTDEDALALIARQRELNFEPGDDYLYSNSGYWLLGQIVERVSGQSLRQFAHERIFEPLGMTRSHFHDDARAIVRGRAMSYSADGRGGFRLAYLGNFDKVGAGGLYTTLGDLARWDANFQQPKIGGPAYLELLHTRGVLNGGDTISYAFGINVQERRGLSVVRHSGSLMGFRADLVRYPEQRFTVLTLCNLGSIDAAGLADRVTDLFLGERLQAAPAPLRTAAPAATGPTAAAVATATPPRAAEYVGRYHSEELDATYTLAASDDALTVTRRLHGTQPLRQLGDDRFAAGSHIFQFTRAASGRVLGFSVEAGRVRNIRFVRQP
jgi:CubicO group peptidase (beta-lactamase class C family)